MDTVLVYERIAKRYRSLFHPPQVALDDFTLEVRRGEMLGFLGPNGAGKTTAIHLALGFMRPDGGSGRLLGRPFGDVAARRRVGFLPESVALPRRSAREVVVMAGALNGVPGRVRRRRAEDMIAAVGLAGRIDSNVSQFSRGMLQRVGLAQALVNDPELLILDEPTSALDPAARVQVRELLLACRREGRTVFLSSHLLSEVEQLCDRIAIVQKGCVLRVGGTDELLASTRMMEIAATGMARVPEALLAAHKERALANGEMGFHVDRSALRPALEAIWAAGGEVVRVAPLRRSLEEVFLDLASAMGDDRGGAGRG